MKAIGKCEVCEGKIIQAGNGNKFCEDCADKNFGEKLQAWADRKEISSRESVCDCGKPIDSRYAPCCSLKCWDKKFL